MMMGWLPRSRTAAALASISASLAFASRQTNSGRPWSVCCSSFSTRFLSSMLCLQCADAVFKVGGFDDARLGGERLQQTHRLIRRDRTFTHRDNNPLAPLRQSPRVLTRDRPDNLGLLAGLAVQGVTQLADRRHVALCRLVDQRLDGLAQRFPIAGFDVPLLDGANQRLLEQPRLCGIPVAFRC